MNGNSINRTLMKNVPSFMQWLEDPNQKNLDNLNNARHKASRHFRNKKEGISERQNSLIRNKQ